MALVVAQFVADGQVVRMAVAAFSQGLDMFQRRGSGQHMLAADPARHHAMQLPRHRFVHFLSGLIQSAHAEILAIASCTFCLYSNQNGFQKPQWRCVISTPAKPVLGDTHQCVPAKPPHWNSPAGELG